MFYDISGNLHRSWWIAKARRVIGYDPEDNSAAKFGDVVGEVMAGGNDKYRTSNAECRDGGSMKITRFETIPIKGRALLLKMHTDEGLVGFGEPLNYEHWRVVAQAVEDMADYLVGKDPFQIEDHWQTLYRSSYSRSMPILVGALSGIEMAMWDVMQKAV